MCEDLIIAYAISMDQNCPLGLIMCAIAAEGLAAGVKQISAGRLQTADPSIPVHKARRDSLAGNSPKIQWGVGNGDISSAPGSGGGRPVWSGIM